MRRRVRRIASAAGLNDVETRFLADLVPHLRTVPRRPRRQIIDELVEMLSSRPASGSLPDLVAALGQPGEAAKRLRREAGFPGPTPWWRHWALLPRAWHVASFGLLVAVVVGGIATRNYYTATPDFHNSCGGAAGPDMETLQAAGRTEYRTSWRERQRYGLMLCPFTQTTGVTVERVYVDVAPALGVQPVGWELSLERLSTSWRGDASANQPWRPEEVPWLGDVIVWLEAEYCSFSGTLFFEHVEIDYEYRGRSRTTTLPLGYRLSIDSAKQCTNERRAVDDAATQRWIGALGGSLPNRGDSVGALGLAPESVSRDLCRYLQGVEPASDRFAEFEPLESRAVFDLNDHALSVTLIDAAVHGICPEFAEQRDDLVALLDV